MEPEQGNSLTLVHDDEDDLCMHVYLCICMVAHKYASEYDSEYDRP